MATNKEAARQLHKEVQSWLLRITPIKDGVDSESLAKIIRTIEDDKISEGYKGIKEVLEDLVTKLKSLKDLSEGKS